MAGSTLRSLLATFTLLSALVHAPTPPVRADEASGEPVWQLPFAAHEAWSVGAPHPSDGSDVDCRDDAVVCDSIDAGPRGGAVGRVRAVAPGVVGWVACETGRYLKVDHGDGWETRYYHLVNVRTELIGSTVAAGEHLGDAGRALPCGGHADFDHVHLVFRHDGRPVDVDGLRIGGHTVHAADRSYHGWWTDAHGAVTVVNDGETAFGIESGPPSLDGWSGVAPVAAAGLDPDDGLPGTIATAGVSTPPGYWMIDDAGGLHPFGSAAPYPGPPLGGVGVVDVATDATGATVWILDRHGRIHVRGSGVHDGDLADIDAALAPGERPAAVLAHPAGTGYWIVTSAGRVSAHGAAPHLGDVSGLRLDAPVIDAVATPSGLGYHLLGADGGIFAFGDAGFAGSVPQVLPLDRLAAPLVAIVPDRDGRGYWLIGADGGVFAFDAAYRGSVPGVLPPGATLAAPVVDAIAIGDGYAISAADGGVFAFADGPFLGSLGGQELGAQVRAIAAVG